MQFKIPAPQENQLGHRFVKHLKLAVGGDHSHPELSAFYENFAEVARGNLTQGQRARLQQLDQHHRWQQVRTQVRCGVKEQTKSAEILKDYKQCVCDGVESVMVCQMQNHQALQKNTQHIGQQIKQNKVALAKDAKALKKDQLAEHADMGFNTSVGGTHVVPGSMPGMIFILDHNPLKKNPIEIHRKEP